MFASVASVVAASCIGYLIGIATADSMKRTYIVEFDDADTNTLVIHEVRLEPWQLEILKRQGEDDRQGTDGYEANVHR